MKVAFATTDGVHVNEHFGRAGKFAVYEFTKKDYTAVGFRVFGEDRDVSVESTRGQGTLHEDAVNAKIKKLEDCGIIYITSIGGPSAARLSRCGIMPVKVKDGMSIEESAKKLSETIRSGPPPWLMKMIVASGHV